MQERRRARYAARNCTRDEGGPFEFGDQEPISSHRKLLQAKAVVVSVAETRDTDFGRQGRERRAQANRCRSVQSGLGDVRNGGDPSSGIIRDQPHALEPTLSTEIELGPESVGRLSICENHDGKQASH
jgi:hypothetical protein